MRVVRLLSIPIWAEGRVAVEYAALLRDPVLRGEGVPRGDGRPVLLVPGFLAGDPSLATMARWLRDLGYRPCRARMRANIDCATAALDRLEVELERLAARHGRRVAIVGQSRGGTMARLLAVRRPDLVDTIVCLGSPMSDQLAIHPLVRLQVTALGALGTLGVRGLFSRACMTGDCCAVSRDQAEAPFPNGVGFVSAYSRTDGIVDWRACLDPAAEQVEVGGSHVGMAVNPRVYRAIAAALATREPALTSRLMADDRERLALVSSALSGAQIADELAPALDWPQDARCCVAIAEGPVELTGDDLVVLARPPGAAVLTRRPPAAIARALGSEVRAGVSAPFALDELGAAREQAETALLCARAGVARVAVWDELGGWALVARLWRAAGRPGPPAPVAALLAADRGRELAETLEALLEADDAAAAAARLGIHRTTLHRRVERAEEASGLRMDAGDDRLVLQLGLRLWRLADGQPPAW